MKTLCCNLWISGCAMRIEHGGQQFEQFLYQLFFTSCSWFFLNKVVFIWVVITMSVKRLTGLCLFYCEVMYCSLMTRCVVYLLMIRLYL